MSTKCVDFSGHEINVGDWILQVTVRPHGLKYAYVVGMTKTNKPRCVSFENGVYPVLDSTVMRGVRYDTGWHRVGPYHLEPDRVFVIDKSRVSQEVLDFVQARFNGDPGFNPEENQI